MKKSSPLTVVEFECGHTSVFSDSIPRKGELVCCRHCGKATRVKSNDGQQWKAICRMPNCKYKSSWGLYGKLAAERAGAKHRRRNGCSDHVVEVINPEGAVHHRYDNQGQNVIPGVIVTDT